MYLASYKTFGFPFPSRCRDAVRHPGQVPQWGMGALLNFPEGTLFYRGSWGPNNVPAKAGNQAHMRSLSFRWIPDLLLLGGLVRNDRFGELCRSFRREKGFLWS